LARAEDDNVRYFRIGTGAAGGTYYPIGAVLANIISNPPGSRQCDPGNPCGVPGLIATAQTTEGSVQNIEELAAGRFDSALCQADIAYWAYRGERIFKGKPPFTGLRLIATLYPELIHIVVRSDSGIRRVGDLKGKRVSLGEPASGTRVHAGIVLAAHALAPDDLVASYLRVGEAADSLRRGRIDAFFFTGGAPVAAVVALADSIPIALVPIAGAPTEPLRRRFPFLTPSEIPSGIYKGVVETPTISVNTLWVVDAKADADIIYGITKALWSAGAKALLESSHQIGKQITLGQALATTSIPLHPGAARYYREAGKLAEPKKSESK
jgi:TRAP transporter TAXI family solute receptor